MSRLLVTGGAGFIGANFVLRHLTHHPDDRVVVLDALTYAGNRDSLQPAEANRNFRFVQGDICDTRLVEKLLRDESVDTVVHFAAESHVDKSITGPDAFVQANIVGTHSLLKAARAVWLAGEEPRSGVRFHHVSTDEVYGDLGPDDPAFQESTPYAPSSPYSASKAASDHLVRAYARTYGLPVTISNCSNNYGPLQHAEKLIPTIIRKALGGEPIPIYGDGSNIRDWLYVEDHCDAIEVILRHGLPGETYNVGGCCERANLQLAKRICESLDSIFPESPHVPHANLIAFVSDRPGHDRRYAVDIEKIRSQLGWEPRESLESGIEKTVRHYVGLLEA